MEIILNKTFCRSLTGALSKKDGFCIRKRGNRFFGCRKRNHQTMPEEHWLFIVTCAKMAQQGLYIADIRVARSEVRQALEEAGLPVAPMLFEEGLFNADTLLMFKRIYNL